MGLHFSHTLCSLPRNKLWILKIHRESQQSYCQEDFSWISPSEEFLTSYPFRYSGRWPASHPGSAWAGYMSGIGLFILTVMSKSACSALPFLGDCITMGRLNLYQGNGTVAEHRHLCQLLCSFLPVLNVLLVLWRLCLLRGLSWGRLSNYLKLKSWEILCRRFILASND